MRIYRMTATFGKLEHQTLTLEPGLNIITAPNEWGKSTWCAFLLAMLYGLDRGKASKNAPADKDRYLPWSGSPMEGRIDLNWQGRDITIQRRTVKRVPLGEFSAFETASGLPVPELTAANCGQMLLGVEQTVFRRAGFIRQADLPVTQDEALRRRLNALVTTGDESGAADHLAQSLKDLKNRCRYNRSGLLPQAEAQYRDLQQKLEELSSLEEKSQSLGQRSEELKLWCEQLRNHQQTLAFTGAQQSAQRIAQAQEDRDRLFDVLQELEHDCSRLPSGEEAAQKVREITLFREQWMAIQLEMQTLPQVPQPPQMPPAFAGMTAAQGHEQVQADAKAFREAVNAKLPAILMALGILGIVGGLALLILKVYVPGAMALGAACAAVFWGVRERKYLRAQAIALAKKYGTAHWERWELPLERYEAALEEYRTLLKSSQDAGGDLDVRYMMLQKKREALFAGQEPETVLQFWQEVQRKWETLQNARREAQQAQTHLDALTAVAAPIARPVQPDTLTCSEEDTARLLADAEKEQQHLLSRMGQYQGLMEALGDKAVLQSGLQRCRQRIDRLEDTYIALTIALETLADARAELQRRFAPRIAKKAQELMQAMTGGRYHSLRLGEDLSLQAAAGEESALRSLQWRSDGTMDQLYLALRLAVAEELTPGTPLILDDALVRFDDQRMTAAVKILSDLSQERQILCFTCQSRESAV